MRNGRKLGKAEAYEKWNRLSAKDKELIAIAVKNLAADPSIKNGGLVKDGHRFIRSGKSEPWREWLQPARANIHSDLNSKNYHEGVF